MRWNNRRIFRGSLLLVLALLVSLVSLPLAHASTYIGFASGQATGSVCPTNCSGPGLNTNGLGSIIQAPFSGQIISAAIFTGTTLPNQIVIATGTTSLTTTSYTCVDGQGGTCKFVNTGQSFTVQDVEALSGLTINTFTTVALASPVTVSINQWVAIVFMVTTGSSANIVHLEVNTGTPAAHTVFDGGNYVEGEIVFATTSPVTGTSYNTNCIDCGSEALFGATFSQTASSGGGTVSVTQCYGNCGSPAITLANTNSTHTVNFNQTITLFYQFQSNVNGFLLNVTTSMAKSYLALPNGPAFGVYTIANCPTGQTPFSTSCPGILQAQSVGQNTFSPPKGKISFSGLRVPVSNGQWVGIALSAFLAGLDVNDTNTNVQMFQTNEGKIPSSIQTPSVFSATSKVGLWAWVNGNVITGSPSPSPNSGNCGPGLDFVLACAVNSLCSIATVQCQTGSSMFLIIVLTFISLGVLLAAISYILPGLSVSTRGIGEFAILIFVGWLAMFGAYGLLLPWLLVLMFFVIAWLFIGKARGSGPI